MTTVDFGITFNKKSFRVTLGKEKTLGDLKNEIHRVTGVGPANQKLMGLVPAGKSLRDISDGTPLGDGLVSGQKWKKPRHKIVLFEASEEEIAKRRDEEQKIIQKTQALREELELNDAREKKIEEKHQRFLADAKREIDQFSDNDSGHSPKRMRIVEVGGGLGSGLLGDPLPGFGNNLPSPFQNGGGNVNRNPVVPPPPVNGNGDQGNNDNSSLLMSSSSNSDLNAKISRTLYMYSSVMAETQGDLLDISGKSNTINQQMFMRFF